MLGAITLIGCNNSKKFEVNGRTYTIPKDSIEKYDPVFNKKIKFENYDNRISFDNSEEGLAYKALYSRKVYPTIANKFIHNNINCGPNGIIQLVDNDITPYEFLSYKCSVPKAISYKEQNIGAFATTFFPNGTDPEVIKGILGYDRSVNNLLFYEELMKSKDGVSFFDKGIFGKAFTRVNNFYNYSDSLKKSLPDTIAIQDASIVNYFNGAMPIGLVKDNLVNNYFNSYMAVELFKEGITDFGKAHLYDGDYDLSAHDISLCIKENINPTIVQNIGSNLDYIANSDINLINLLDKNVIDYANKIATLNKEYDGDITIDDVLDFHEKNITPSEIENVLKTSYVRKVIND